MSGLETRELLAPMLSTPVQAGTFPKAPPGDFGTVSRPTLVQHPDVPRFDHPLWDAAREYSYGSSLRDRFFLFSKPGSHKLVFFIHGGGFFESDPTQRKYYPLYEKFWSEGYSIASIDYRLRDEAEWPGPIWAATRGIVAANRFVGSTITHRIIAGASAGASIGALILYSADPKYPTLPFKVDAFIGASGVYVVPWLKPGPPGEVPPARIVPEALHRAFRGSPKTTTPAFIVAGDHDPTDDWAGTPNSDLMVFARYLIRGGTRVVAMVATGAGGDHKGPYTALDDVRLDRFYTRALR